MILGFIVNNVIDRSKYTVVVIDVAGAY